MGWPSYVLSIVRGCVNVRAVCMYGASPKYAPSVRRRQIPEGIGIWLHGHGACLKIDAAAAPNMARGA